MTGNEFSISGMDGLPLGHAQAVATMDPDDAADQIGRIFCPHGLDPKRQSDSPFFAKHNSVRLDGYSLNAVQYGGDVDIDPGCLDNFYLLQVPLSGRAMVHAGDRTVLSAPGRTASLLSPTRYTKMTWRDSCAQLILFIERRMLESRIEHLLDHHVDEVVFAPELSLDSPSGNALLGQIGYLRMLLEQGGAMGSHAQVLMRDSLINSLLLSQNHNYSRNLEGQPVSEIAPKAVKRAREYLEQHYQDPDVCEGMVIHANVSLRTLQSGFKKYFGKTITEFLQDVRLEALHRMLLTADGTSSVSDLMLEAGFTHLGRTAGAYRARFGKAPSKTLDRH